MWKAGSVCVNVGLGQRVPLTGDEGVPSAAATHALCWQCFPKTIDNSEQEVALPAVTAQMPQRLSHTIAPHPLTSHMGVRLEWERKKRLYIKETVNTVVDKSHTPLGVHLLPKDFKDVHLSRTFVAPAASRALSDAVQFLNN